MNFIDRYIYLKSVFNLRDECIPLHDPAVEIRNVNFCSDFSKNEFVLDKRSFIDSQINENLHFNYPVFVPVGNKKNNKAILLVHGLNERSWNKHLGWAYQLCKSTGKSVILFPISYHMNRGPAIWTDPHEMGKLIEIRKNSFPGIQYSTIVNLALSERLTMVPQRFFMSGFNYADDLIKLIKDIKSGNHPLLQEGTEIDYFAYSIGVFLMQCLIMADPENLFRNSKFVFFAGGSLFSEMNGVSRFIMDNKAFERIYHYFLNEMEEEILHDGEYSRVLGESSMGKAFRAMIRADKYKKMRDKVIDYFRPRILIIALRDDKVVPLKGILDLFGKQALIKVMHFKFPCIHENPFPVHLSHALESVDKAFNKVFMQSAAFLA